MKLTHAFAVALAFLGTLPSWGTDTLIRTIAPPYGVPQRNSNAGESVAVGASYVVVGATGHGDTFASSGMAHVYSATTGALVCDIFNPSPAAVDVFGRSVAVSGNLVAVGAPNDDTTAGNAGSVYIYDMASGTPTVPVRVLANPSPAAGDAFGAALSFSGTRLAVGVPGDDSLATDAGAIYVFDLASGTPTVPVATLLNPDPVANEYFGTNVAMDGNRIVAGVPWESSVATFAGRAYVFEPGGFGTLVLNNPSPTVLDNFGHAVAISGNRVAIGAPNKAGAQVFLYDLASGTPGTAVQTVENPSPASGDFFGGAVALTGARLVVGDAQDDTQGGNAGRAFVFDVSGAVPALSHTLANPVAADFNALGHSVAAVGDIVVAGVPGSDTQAQNAGAALLFNLASGTPETAVAVMDSTGPSVGDQFGNVVASSGRYLAATAHFIGQVSVYDLQGPTPGTPLFTLNYGANFGDVPISLSMSGTRLLVGVPSHDVGATADVGRAYLYDVAGASPSVPVQIFENPNPHRVDYFGTAVALSGDRVAIGTPAGGGNISTGKVYAYNLAVSATPTHTLTHPTPAFQDFFGRALAIDGTMLLVGSSGTPVGVNPFVGSAHLFDLTAGATPLLNFTNPTPESSDYFGSQVAIHGPRIVIGAAEDNTAGFDAGSVYIYNTENPTPTTPVLTLGGTVSASFFGESLALSGDRLYVTSRPASVSRVNAYDLGSLTPSVPAQSILLPENGRLCILGDSFAAGLPFHDTFGDNKGAVFLYGPNAAPTVTLLGTTPLTIEAALTYTDAGATATDPDDGPLTPTLTSNTVVANAPGSYEVIWTATDTAGATNSAIRAVTVVDTTAPAFGEIPTFGPALAGNPLDDYRAYVTPTDLVGVFSYEQTPTPGTPLTAGIQRVTLTAMDSSENTATVEFDITVEPSIVVTPLFTKGDIVPNSGVDSRIPAGSVWSTFGTPAVDENGDLAFIGGWKSSAGSATGIFAGPFTELIVRTGQAATDPLGDPLSGVTFKSFKAPVYSNGGLAFIATLTGPGTVPASDTAIYHYRAGTLRLVVREGGSVGVLPGVHASSVPHLFSSVAVNGDQVLFTASLTEGGDVTPANDTGAWSWVARSGLFGEYAPIVREGEAISGISTSPVKTFTLLKSSLGSAGAERGQSGSAATFQVALANTSHLILTVTSLGVEKEFATGDATVPDSGGATWTTFSAPATSSGTDALAFLGGTRTLFGLRPTTTTRVAYFAGDTHFLTKLGDTAPGTGRTFIAFKNPVLAPSGGTFAFAATAISVVLGKQNGIWWLSPHTGSLEYATNTEAGIPGTLPGSVWKSFTSLAATNYGPLFTASLLTGPRGGPGPGMVTSLDDIGLWATDSSGNLQLLLREGQTIGEGGREGGGTTRTIRSFTVLTAPSGTTGVRRSYNAGGTVAVLVNYGTAGTGIIKIQIP